MNETVNENENNENNEKPRRSHTAAIGLLFIVIALIIFLSAFGYGYFQLTKHNIQLAKEVLELQTQTANDQAEILALQKTFVDLQQTIQQTSRTPSDTSADITPIYLRLSALDKAVDQLPLPPRPLTSDVTSTEAPLSSSLTWWQAGLAHTLQALHKIVIIRNTSLSALPLVLPEEKIFLYQNLHAQFESAMWAVLHHNDAIFQDALTRIQTWIETYFDGQAAATKNMLENLKDLQKNSLQSSAVNTTAPSAEQR